MSPHSSIVINKKIIGLPSTVQLNSLQFDQTNTMRSITPATVGISNTWSLMIWAKNTANPSNVSSKGLMSIANGFAAANQITMDGDGGGDVNEDLRIIAKHSAGQIVQLKAWANVQLNDTDTWVQYFLTWGGAAGVTGTNSLELKLYTQGVDRGAPDTSSIDKPSTDGPGVTDTARECRVGIAGTNLSSARYVGTIYSAAVYNSILSASEITAMYNGGNARDFDLESDHSGYTSSGNLLHYFRFGIGSTESEFGTDHTAITNDLSMEHGATNGENGWEAADLTTDIPL